MAFRIDIHKTVPDTRAAVYAERFKKGSLAKALKNVWVVDSYLVDAVCKSAEQKKIAQALTDLHTESFSLGDEWSPHTFSWAIEIGFLPGVTDNVGSTAREAIEDLLRRKFRPAEAVYTSRIFFLSGALSTTTVQRIVDTLYNPLIERARVLPCTEFKKAGFGTNVPKVILSPKKAVTKIDLEIPDDQLSALGKLGIVDSDGMRRGPLALDLSYLKAIRTYFRKVGRQPTDIELETFAQTWSEHCKHTIMASPIDEIRDGLFKTYIQGATKLIRARKGKKDFCVSVFKDNSGGILFNDDYLITHKVETHNSPSALDPFGGAVTGIVGVNRDTIGFGLGAKPIINTYGFCLADPTDSRVLYRDKAKKEKMLSARRIMDGVIAGVNSGGNQSGIPTPHGFLFFDPRFRGKPLVFVGTIGLIPRVKRGHKLYEKKARKGDYIVMAGGRVGRDGIHGATFSSEAIDTGSPATAVQIGDPITQKKMSDALVKEARDRFLYTSITDDGAGGLSSSVGEMAGESGGCEAFLDKVPLKYPGLSPWEIWISESQERMTLAVPPKKWKEFSTLMKQRGVEATVIGRFTASGRCVVKHKNRTIVDIDLAFLHDGFPRRPLASHTPKKTSISSVAFHSRTLSRDIVNLLARPTIASREFISQQYDHEVQAGAVLKPLVGRGRVDADAAIMRPLLDSWRGVVVASGILPTYSDHDAYLMTAAAVDTAIRNAIVAGGQLDHLALLDNFCWCSSMEPQRLYELKRAAKACYDYGVAFGTPFVSGKDSMFNDFKGFDDKGPVSISIPPTLLITAFGVVEDVRRAITCDFKKAGDSLYLLGTTNAELAGSEYAMMLTEKGNKALVHARVPVVVASKNKRLYMAFTRAAAKGLVASGVGVGRGGLIVALAKCSLAGGLGAQVSLTIAGDAANATEKLFSESQGRILVSIAPENEQQFTRVFSGIPCTKLGVITKSQSLIVKDGRTLATLGLSTLGSAYRKTFEGF
jgi:phosphoribosylformylglycinamidine synthase subunit PurSL